MWEVCPVGPVYFEASRRLRWQLSRKVAVSTYSPEVNKQYPPDVVVQRALDRVDEDEYNFGANNCEHFATWCKCGHHECSQINDVKAVVENGFWLWLTAKAAVVPAIGLTGAASVMKTLGFAGGLVGGGAAAGVGVLAAAPAMAANNAVGKILLDSPYLPQGERDARAAGRAGAAIGGAAGVFGAGASLAGLSGAGMAMQLAAIGSVVGKGMVAGAVITATAPAVAAIAFAAAFYGFAKASKVHTEAAQDAKANLCTWTTSQVLAELSTDPFVLAQLLEMLGDGLPYIEVPTLGGHVFWTDMAEANGWKLQRNDVFGNCRINDNTERGKAWGQTAKMDQAISQLAKDLSKPQNKEKGDASIGLRLVATSSEAHQRLCSLLGHKWPLQHQPSMGGHVFWTVLDSNSGWRFQKNDVLGNCRILDAVDVVKAWGGETKMKVALATVAVEFSSSPEEQNKSVVTCDGKTEVFVASPHTSAATAQLFAAPAQPAVVHNRMVLRGTNNVEILLRPWGTWTDMLSLFLFCCPFVLVLLISLDLGVSG